MPTKRSGFTLIELLVVLAVLVILAAILLPVFASARHRARMTACASNLHQIALAFHQYAADNDNCYPLDDPIIAHTPHLVWTLLTPYTKNTAVFHCPEAEGPFENIWGYDYVSGSHPFFSGEGPVLKAPRPGSGAVIALCGSHAQRVMDGSNPNPGYTGLGPVIIVREDGAASQIDASQIERWIYQAGQWRPAAGIVPQHGDFVRSRFPGEEWPPQD